MEKSLLRQSLRNHIRLWRRALSPQEQTDAALRVVSHVMNDARIRTARTLAVFLSFDGELDTRPLIDALWTAGKQVYLPVLHPFTPDHLLFMHYTAATPLVLNRLRIREPRLDITTLLPLAGLDILFTPLVAFDSQGQRLGMGGGFYDRTLQHWRRQEGFYPIGLAHDCQQSADPLPVEEWDMPLPEIITPSCHWRWPDAGAKTAPVVFAPYSPDRDCAAMRNARHKSPATRYHRCRRWIYPTSAGGADRHCTRGLTLLPSAPVAAMRTPRLPLSDQ